MRGPTSVYHLSKAFDISSNVGGTCGEIVALKVKYKQYPAQNLEYKMSNILDKPLKVCPGTNQCFELHSAHPTNTDDATNVETVTANDHDHDDQRQPYLPSLLGTICETCCVCRLKIIRCDQLYGFKRLAPTSQIVIYATCWMPLGSGRGVSCLLDPW